MNENAIVFELNESEKIVIDIGLPLENLACYCETPILFYKNTWTYPLSTEDIKENIDIFYTQLTQVLNNELQLDSSITSSIGYIYNTYLKHSLDLPEHWIGTDYQLFGNKGLATWLYNDQDGSIIFEITPVYLEEYEKIADHGKALFFENWMKNYTPYIHRKIPVHTAHAWIRHANLIRCYIDDKFNNKNCYQAGNKKIYQQCVRSYGEDTRLSQKLRILWLQSYNTFLQFFTR